jgi:pilus assembly protein FimV
LHEPFLNFLVEVEWPNGRLLREYTILLDPPVLMDQPGGAMTQTRVVASQPRAASATSMSAEQPDGQSKVSGAQSDQAPAQEKTAARVSGPRAIVDKTRIASIGYTVVPGDTLAEIARRYLPDENTSLSQMMMAILRTNPDAFSQGNINNLRAGVILAIPTDADVAAVDAEAALAAVTQQNELWRNNGTARQIA